MDGLIGRQPEPGSGGVGGAHPCSPVIPGKSPRGPSPDAQIQRRETLFGGNVCCRLASPQEHL